MSKRISEVQWQGITGEKAFEYWATRNGILPTKLEPDQGIDFVCQVIGNKTKKKSYETPGHLLATSVRSSDKTDVKVKLDRSDAELLLRLQLPTALVILDLRSTGEVPDFYFRFLDREFIQELLAFLNGTKKSRSVKASTCLSNPQEILSTIKKAFLPGAWEKIQSVKRELRLRSVIKDAVLKVVNTGESSYSLVSIPRFFDQYKTGASDVQASIEAAVFGRQEFFGTRLQSIPLRDGLLEVLGELPPPILIEGIASEEHGNIEISAIKNNHIDKCEFTIKKHDIWTAYCHECGYAIKISEAVEQDGQRVHLTEDFIDHETRVAELMNERFRKFLIRARGEAEIAIGDRLRIPASNFPSLNPFGWLCVYLQKLGNQDWLSTANWRADEVTEEDLQSLRFLCSTKEKPELLSEFGFVLGEFDSKRMGNDYRKIKVPVCMNLQGQGVICWLHTDGTLFLEPNGRNCIGIRLGSISEMHYEVVGHQFPTTGFPMMKIFSDWPAVLLHQIEQEFVWGNAEDWGVELQIMEE